MANTDLNIRVRLNDQVSASVKKIEGSLSGMGQRLKDNWLGVTATFAASAYALKKVFDVMELGAKAQQVENSFANMAARVGQSADSIRAGMDKAAAGTVNFSNVAGRASALLQSGLGEAQIVGLMEAARAKAQIFGETTEQAFEKISSAITGGFMVSLKRSYGMIVDNATAIENYATQTGLTKNEVEKFHLQQALANEVLRQSKADMDATRGSAMTHAETIQYLANVYDTLKEKAGQTLWKIVEGWQGIGYAIGALTAGGGLDAMFPPGAGQPTVDTLVNINMQIIRLREELGVTGGAFLQFDSSATMGQQALTAAIQASNAELSTLQRQARATADEYSSTMKGAAEAAKKASDAAFKAWHQSTAKVSDSMRTMTSWIEKSAKQGSGMLVDNLGLALGNIVLGTQSASEAFASFGRTMIYYLIQMVAKLLIVLALVTMLNMIPGGSAVLKLMDLGSFQTGTPFVPQTGLALVHKGERIVPAHQNRAGGSGGGGGGGGETTVVYHINAVDSASFADMLNNNAASVHAIVQDGMQRNLAIRGTMRRYS